VAVSVSRQPEVQSKVDLLSASLTTVAEATVQAEHRLNLARSHKNDRENGYENRSPVFSYELSPSVGILFLNLFPRLLLISGLSESVLPYSEAV